MLRDERIAPALFEDAEGDRHGRTQKTDTLHQQADKQRRCYGCTTFPSHSLNARRADEGRSNQASL